MGVLETGHASTVRCITVRDLLRNLITGGVLTGFVDPAKPLLSEFSEDQLWTALDATLVLEEPSVDVAEYLMRLINLRRPLDGWHYGRAADILADTDLTVLSGAGAIAFDITDPANPVIKYTENAVPNGAMECKIAPPANYVLEPLDANLLVSASAATYSLNLHHGAGTTIGNLISELLNLQKFWRSEGNNQWGDELACSGNDYFGLVSSVEMGANVTLKVPMKLRWRRQPTWIARV